MAISANSKCISAGSIDIIKSLAFSANFNLSKSNLLIITFCFNSFEAFSVDRFQTSKLYPCFTKYNIPGGDYKPTPIQLIFFTFII